MKKYGALVLLATLCSCGSRKIDENYAAEKVKAALSLSGPVTAQRLSGGFSGASLFTVTAGTKKYVARFLAQASAAERQHEIACMQVASAGGYGPQVYFADRDTGLVIMEYLHNEPITLEQRKSDQLYAALAHLLQKIHRGPKFPTSVNIFDEVDSHARKVAEVVKKHKNCGVPFAKIEEISATLRKALACSSGDFVPCHNDLQPRNLVFTDGQFEAIDFEAAAQSDPYFDLAVVAVYCCPTPAFEHVMHAAYLEHTPSAQEEARLYLTKQVAWLINGLYFLRSAQAKIDVYATLQVPAYRDFLRAIGMGEISLEKDEEQIAFAKVMLAQVLANAETQAFRDAVAMLGCAGKAG